MALQLPRAAGIGVVVHCKGEQWRVVRAVQVAAAVGRCGDGDAAAGIGPGVWRRTRGAGGWCQRGLAGGAAPLPVPALECLCCTSGVAACGKVCGGGRGALCGKLSAAGGAPVAVEEACEAGDGSAALAADGA